MCLSAVLAEMGSLYVTECVAAAVVSVSDR
jgi:hypothetical protein